MVKPTEIVADVEFILAECNRLRAAFRASPKSVDPMDMLCWLPHPSGSGHISCGRAALRRLDAVSTAALRRAKLERRVDVSKIRPRASELLVERFLRDRREIDVRQTARLVGAIERAANTACEDLIHFIPCHLMVSKEPEVLDLGPVRFLGRRAFRKRALELFRQDAELHGSDEDRFGRDLLAETLGYFRQFDWVAEVAIARCQPSVSERLAMRAVTSALDCLHLILGVEFTDKMRIGGSGLRNDRRARLCARPNGGLNASLSTAWPGQVGFGEGWSKALWTPDRQRQLRLSAVALETVIDPDLERPLSRRFLDAAQWYGEATREDSPATKIVKYVTALERMLMTDERDEIASIVSERAAALAFEPDLGDREAWRQKVKSVYDLRSRLLHGSLSPWDPEVSENVAIAAEIGERTLFMAAHIWHERGLRELDMSTGRLAEWFAKILDHANILEQSASSRSQ